MLASLSLRNQKLFEALRQWRSQTAKCLGKPPYVIFKDTTLLEIAVEHPASEDELRQISGVGEKKLLNYGEDVLQIVAKEM
ncbi:protein containing Helicase and RNase D [gut metagenome]|uniref:DNA 3'-5' helicase n=1 Tax=gut metagenome TaxID=749906 RepID=J9D5Z4_9ZZZZ